jgi:pyridoxamine 5'-phosphate oxidase
MVKVSPKISEDFNRGIINPKEILQDPSDVFASWFQNAVISGIKEPDAMILATTGKDLRPAARIVLLKEYDDKGFIFYTNYQSRKAKQITDNAYGALLFPWHAIQRQVRIEGRIEKVADSKSDEYFSCRPTESKMGAWISPQSQEIPSRTFLENEIIKFKESNKEFEISRPPHWGGYRLIPDLYEFWQSGPARLHDRIEYYLENDNWKHRRLAP